MSKAKSERSVAEQQLASEETGVSTASARQLAAEAIVSPVIRNAQVAHSFGSRVFSGPKPSGDELVAPIVDVVRSAGDLAVASRTLAAQAVSLDAIFTELASRAGDNLGGNPDIVDRYLRLALKAQSSCRSTLEALARLHQPREQIVKHVHVNEGGQAVVADHFHHHPRGEQNGKPGGQPHAPGDGAAGESTALPSPDSFGSGMPSSGRKRKSTLPNARGQGKRSAARQ